MPTRRAVTIALAAVPFAGAAEASTPDPVFAAIEAHRAARAVTRAMEGTDPDEDAFNALVAAETDRLAALLEMTPATPAGCAAMMRYVETYLCEEDSDRTLFSEWAEEFAEPGATLLGRLAGVIEQAPSRSLDRFSTVI